MTMMQQSGIGAKGPAQTPKKQSASKAARSALERLDTVERTIGEIMEGTNSGFQTFRRDMNATSEFIEACVDLLGRETVEARMRDNRVQRVTKHLAEKKAALDAAVTAGQMIVCDAVAEDGLVVGIHTDAEGAVIPPGRVQIAFQEFGPDIAPLFTDKTVGTKIDLPDKTSFEITELYRPNPTPPPAEQPATAAPAETSTTEQPNL